MKKIGVFILVWALLLIGASKSYAGIYFPHVACIDSWQTEICLINTSTTETVTGNLLCYSDAGSLVATVPVTLRPNARQPFTVNTDITNAYQIGYILFDTDSNTTVGYTKFYINSVYRAALPAVAEVNSGDIPIAHIASDAAWWTGISLVNTTALMKTLTVEFDNGTSKIISLNAGEHRAFMIRTLFDGTPQPNIHSAVIKNGAGVIGLELFGSSSLLDGVPLSDKTSKDLYFPHVASDATWWTGIAVYNPNSTAVMLTIEAYSNNGTLLNTQTKNIPQNQNYVRLATDLGLPANTAWLHVSAPNPISGFELFGTANQLAGYSVVNINTASGLFAKRETSGWTGIAFVNTGNTSANINLTALDNNGNVVADKTIILANHAKQVGMIENLFSGMDISNATYVKFSSDQDIVGFQLNSDSNNTVLDALPALAIDELRNTVDGLLSLLTLQSSLGSGQGEITTILQDALGGVNGTCPAVTITPPVSSIVNNIPPDITVSVDYAPDCIISSGANVTGNLLMHITDLAQTDSGVSLNYSVTATNVTLDGQTLLNGSVAGTIDIGQSTVSLSATFTNFTIAGKIFSGSITAVVNGFSMSGDSIYYDSITLTFNNFKVSSYSIDSGTVVVTNLGGGVTQVAADVTGGHGPTKVTFTITQPTATRTVIKTAEPGTLAGYTVIVYNLTLDTAVCENYPIDGIITLIKDGQNTALTFTNSCNGEYTISR